MNPASANRVYNTAFWEGMRPDPLLTVSQWADRYRILSQKASAEPGRWDTERTPYLREIMDVLSPMSTVEEVHFMKGAQVGGTECGNNWIGYVIDWAPGPMMGVQPTVDLAKRNSKQRIQPLIEECPRLSEKVKASKSRDSGNTILEKDFPGGRLVLTGANSAVGLRSMPARYLFLDEVDGYPGDVDGEGEPTALAKARTRTFKRNKKIFNCSTPTFAGRSRIESGYDNSDRRKYHVPCPHCAHTQHLKWSQLHYEIFKNAVGKDEPRDVHYVCESCSGRIEEYHKTWMLKNGRWVAEFPGVRGGKVAGFHLNSMYSPLGWFSWADAVQQWLDAQGKPEELRGFINTVLGETWKDKGDAPEWQRLYERREEYQQGTLPSTEIYYLTAGVDVQAKRIEYEVVGWGKDKQSWSVEYGIIEGDTSTEAPWNELAPLLQRTWTHTKGYTLPLRFMAVDSGFNTQVVYNWVRKQPLTQVMAVKGMPDGALLLSQPSSVDVRQDGRKIKRGLRLWPVGVGVAKTELYGWLKLDAPLDGQPFLAGYCHFPQYGDEYFKQLTAEQLVVRIVKGQRRYTWEKTRDRNEALDCRVYARAAAARGGLDRNTDEQWEDLRNVGQMVQPAERGQGNEAEAPRTQRNEEDRPRRKSTLRGWRDR